VSASVARCRRALHKHTTHPARSTARARTARARTAGARNASMGGASTHNASMHSASTKHGPAHPRDVDDVDGRRPHDVDDRYTRLSQAHHGVRSVKRTAAGSAVPRPCLPSLAAVGRRRLGAVCVALALANCAWFRVVAPAMPPAPLAGAARRTRAAHAARRAAALARGPRAAVAARRPPRCSPRPPPGPTMTSPGPK